MFRGASAFNQAINPVWDVSSVTDMSYMFEDAIAFNEPLNSWDVSNVRTMQGMFKGATSFNQPLGSWDVRNTPILKNMFQGATSFNQDISVWPVLVTASLEDMFLDSGMVGNTYGLSTPTPFYVEFRYYTPHWIRMCFLEGTKIATEQGEVCVEHLKKGAKVETLRNGFVPITHIGTRVIKHNAEEERVKDQLYVCPKSAFPDLHEDLVVTGCHSILPFRVFNDDDEKEKVKEVLGDIFVTDGRYRIPACVMEETQVYPVKGTFHVYHFSLEHEDPIMNYGVYANNLLVESASNRHMLEMSDFTLIE